MTVVADLPARPLTLDDVTRLAEAGTRHRFELSEGNLLVMPPRTWRGQRYATSGPFSDTCVKGSPTCSLPSVRPVGEHLVLDLVLNENGRNSKMPRQLVQRRLLKTAVNTIVYQLGGYALSGSEQLGRKSTLGLLTIRVCRSHEESWCVLPKNMPHRPRENEPLGGVRLAPANDQQRVRTFLQLAKCVQPETKGRSRYVGYETFDVKRLLWGQLYSLPN